MFVAFRAHDHIGSMMSKSNSKPINQQALQHYAAHQGQSLVTVGTSMLLQCMVPGSTRFAWLQVCFPLFDLCQEASPTSLKESDSVITVNVFDEVVTPTAAARAARSNQPGGGGGGDNALTEGPRLPDRERRFLGCFRIPLAAVYQAEVMHGAFKVRSVSG